MAKKSSINKNEHRRQLVARLAAKRKQLKADSRDESKTLEERFQAQLKLAEQGVELPEGFVQRVLRAGAGGVEGFLRGI